MNRPTVQIDTKYIPVLASQSQVDSACQSGTLRLPKFRPVKSTWIEGIAYVRLDPSLRKSSPGMGIVLIKSRSGSTYAYLAPSWAYGLLCAAKSPGRVYNRLLKGKELPSVKIN